MPRKNIFEIFLAAFGSFSFFSSAPAQPTYFHPTIGIQGTFAGRCATNSCSGIYIDDGGITGNYSNGVNSVYRTFCPDAPGHCIKLTFTAFELEPAHPTLGCISDKLSIGNGPTENSPLVWGTVFGDGCGSTPP